MAYGGNRPNAGRKTSASPFGEPTFQVRLPISIKPQVDARLSEIKALIALAPVRPSDSDYPLADEPSKLKLVLFDSKVAAGTTGFPSPAENWIQKKLDLNKHLIKNPPATFLHRVGKYYDSMIDEGILPDAMLVVDRSANIKSGDVVLAVVNGEKMVKIFSKRGKTITLLSSNKLKNYPPITFKEGDELSIEGAVKWSLNAHS